MQHNIPTKILELSKSLSFSIIKKLLKGRARISLSKLNYERRTLKIQIIYKHYIKIVENNNYKSIYCGTFNFVSYSVLTELLPKMTMLIN